MHCLNCQKTLLNTQKKFCSRSCSATTNNKLKERTPWTLEQKQAFSKKMTKLLKIKQCCVCNMSFTIPYRGSPRRTCSTQCANKILSEKRIQYIKQNHSKFRGHGKQSYMEETFETWLKQSGLSKSVRGYLTEIHFYNKAAKKHGFCDFVFPKIRLIIELDGTHHLKRQAIDKIRDEHLRSRGWEVLRVTIREYYNKSKLPLIHNKLVPLTGLEPI